MTTLEALEIIKVIRFLSKMFDEDSQKFAKSICFLNEKRAPIINRAIELNNQFADMDIIKRGELLGIKINKCPDGYETEPIILSES